MRLPNLILGLALFATPALGADASDKDTESCGNHGTSIEFLDTPSEAARKALKEEKLVFVLHVSGNFEDPRHT
jgi:hypothetical protein